MPSHGYPSDVALCPERHGSFKYFEVKFQVLENKIPST